MGEKFEKITTRTLLIIILLPIILFIIHLGGLLYYTAIILFSILAFWESRCIVANQGYRLSLLPGVALTIFFLFQEKLLNLYPSIYVKLFFVILFFVILFEQFFSKNKSNSVLNICLTLFFAVYTGQLLSFFLSIIELEKGKLILIFVLFITWISDTVAYLFGVKFGKKHPFPYISPNKTVEGALAGIFGGIICALIFYTVLPVNIYVLLLLGAITSISGQAGDLFESLIKRNFGVKDSGNLIPGHGGILDCIDSILFSIPILYYIFRVIL